MIGTGHHYSRIRGLIFIALAMAAANFAAAQDEVYRLKVLRGAGDQESRDFKIVLESMGYLPVYIVPGGSGRDVYYGNFANRNDALKMKAKLERDGFSVDSVDKTPRQLGAMPGGDVGEYTVLVGEYDSPEGAGKIKDQLDKLGTVGVRIEGQRVLVGKFKSSTEATNVAVSLQDRGFNGAKAVSLSGAGAAPEPGVDKGAKAKILQDITSKEKNLTAEQKRAIDELVEAKLKAAGSGGANQALVNQVVELEKKLNALGTTVTDIDSRVKEFSSQREIEARNRVTIAQNFRAADTLAKAGKLPDAITKIREILNMEPENAIALNRLRMLESMGQGEDFEGQKARQDKEFEVKKAMAQQEESRGTLASLIQAKGLWQQMGALHERYAPEAEGRIAQLDAKIKIKEAEVGTGGGGGGVNKNLIIMLVGAVVLLGLIVGYLFVRSQRERRDMIAKIQEATSLRPMRGIPQGRRASDWMLMAPGANPGEGGEEHGHDPAMGGNPASGGGMGMGAAPQGGGFGPQAGMSGSAMDDLFAPEPSDSRGAGASAPAAMAAAGGASVDDILSGGSAPAPGAASMNKEIDLGFGDILGGSSKPAAAQAKADDGISSGFSIDDILGAGSGNGTPEPIAKRAPAEAKPAGGSSIFDDLEALTGGSTKTAPSKPAPAGVGAAMGDPSLDALLGLGGAAPQAKGGKPAGGLASDDMPALKLDLGSSDPLSGLGFLGEETIIERPSVGPAKPSGGGGGFDFGSLGLTGGSPEAAETIGALGGGGSSLNGAAFSADFEKDAIGKRPAGWDGDYPYSELVVENDTPPDGSANYLVYRKKEGVGKVYYSSKFPNTSGVVQVDFDMRCNDKNKFLLGFYIEKDEDFQQSIHTKILRSEAQTAPSIHIHGQPAPYLLGTWAHIKYVIDLNRGKVDGYVDDRHVAKGVPLPQTPPYLNTLSIRDNINTTGILLIDNVKVQKVG